MFKQLKNHEKTSVGLGRHRGIVENVNESIEYFTFLFLKQNFVYLFVCLFLKTGSHFVVLTALELIM